MPDNAIVYLGHIQDEETLATVRFNIRGRVWNYVIDALDLHSVAGVARYSAGRALAYAKKHAIKEYPDRGGQPLLFAKRKIARELLAAARELVSSPDDIKKTSQEIIEGIEATLMKLRLLRRLNGFAGFSGGDAVRITDAFAALNRAQTDLQHFSHDLQPT